MHYLASLLIISTILYVFGKGCANYGRIQGFRNGIIHEQTYMARRSIQQKRSRK